MRNSPLVTHVGFEPTTSQLQSWGVTDPKTSHQHPLIETANFRDDRGVLAAKVIYFEKELEITGFLFVLRLKRWPYSKPKYRSHNFTYMLSLSVP